MDWIRRVVWQEFLSLVAGIAAFWCSPYAIASDLAGFSPTSCAADADVYPLDPYHPGKIPVVLIHGIWSSPKVWITMLDALRADPALHAAFQFWVVVYPSSYPLPLAALSVRQSLRDIRRRLDPLGIDPALNQMIILGKSTGGQVTRMLVEPSGDRLWNATFTCSIEHVCAAPRLRAELTDAFFFKPEPYVRRVIFVTTAHRGTKLGARPGIRFAVRLICRNNPLRHAWHELAVANDLTVFQPHVRTQALSGADGLEAENPMLIALDAQAIAGDVVYHSIIANITHKITPDKINDGLVDYRSAHLDGAASERIVAASHVCEDDPEVIDEVSRILHVHLAEAINRKMDRESWLDRPYKSSVGGRKADGRW